MLNRTQPKTLLQIFFEIILLFYVIVKSINDPDDNVKTNSYSLTHLPSERPNQPDYFDKIFEGKR